VDLLLRLEDAPHKVLLQLLVGKVDAELLEAIVLEDLEAEHVEQADEDVLRANLALARRRQRNVREARVLLAQLAGRRPTHAHWRAQFARRRLERRRRRRALLVAAVRLTAAVRVACVCRSGGGDA